MLPVYAMEFRGRGGPPNREALEAALGAFVAAFGVPADLITVTEEWLSVPSHHAVLWPDRAGNPLDLISAMDLLHHGGAAAPAIPGGVAAKFGPGYALYRTRLKQ